MSVYKQKKLPIVCQVLCYKIKYGKILKTFLQGVERCLAGKSTWCQAWEGEFNPENIQGGRREIIPKGCPLTFKYDL